MTSKRYLANIGLVVVVALLLAVVITVATQGVLLSEATYKSPSLNDYMSDTPAEGVHIDWEALRAINPRVVGWVHVEDTPIDYPLVQAPVDDPEFYLTHDFYDRANALGTPYVSATSSLDDPIAWIFGHHAVSGRLFSAFSTFTDPTFAQERAITLYTPGKNNATNTLSLVTSAVCVVDANTEEGVVTDFANDAELLRWYKQRYHDATVQLKEAHLGDKLRAFVTCSYTTFENERTIVFAYQDC